MLESDAEVGGIRALVTPTPDIALGGRTLKIGGSQNNGEWSGLLTGAGALTMVRGEVQTLTATQSYAGVTRLENGSLRLGKTAGRTVAWWRFDDEADIGKDSGGGAFGNTLVKVGTPTQWYTNDAVRGGALALDNGAYLTGQGANKVIAGLPTNNAPFTVAFWIKPDVSVTNTAILYGWGTFDSAGRGIGLRLNLASPATPFLHADWLTNPTVPYWGDLKDGAWHHVAVVYTGTQFHFHVDGVLTRAFTETAALSVTAGNFRIGNGWLSGAYYTGLIDDFVIADWAMQAHELYAVRVAAQEPDTSVYAVDDLLPATAKIEVGYNGSLYLSGDQTVATLGGEGAAGGIALENGGMLTANGTGGTTSTVFRSSISGDGAFVKRGAGYTLTLGGGCAYTGATDVEEGSLALMPQRVLAGLQAYYRFDDAGNLGKDSSGNGYDLVASNTPSFAAAGKISGAASFSSADRDLLLARVFPATLPTGNDSYTYTVWCNPSGNTAGMPLFWGGVPQGMLNASLFRFDGSNKILLSNFSNNQPEDVGFNLFDDALSNGWHHIASTFDASTGIRRLYVDGSLKWTDPTSRTLAISGTLLQLGGAYYSTTSYYDGLMDELMIFDRALSLTEIQAAMAGWKSVRGVLSDAAPSLTPVARYRFEDAANPGKDSGPYGYDLASSSTNAVTLSGTGKRGSALNLSGAYGYLSWTNSVFPAMMPTGNQEVTLSAWINPKTGADAEGTVIFWGRTAPKQCHVLRLRQLVAGNPVGISYADGYLPNVESDAVSGPDFGTADMPEGWHHVAAVYGVGIRSLYVDGVLLAQDIREGLSVTTNAFYIGRMETPANKWFQGWIDEVEIYNRALSPTEVLSLIRAGADILPSDTVLNVAVGAKVDLDSAAQQVASLTGTGELDLGMGALTVSGGTGTFGGTLTGEGDLAVRDGASLTLTGTNTFSGSVTVSNATLLISGSATGGVDVAVQAGGVLGGSGAITGDVTFDDGAALAAGADALMVAGTVTLGAAGTVTVSLPSGFTGGRFDVISATTLSSPSGLSGWTVSGVEASWKTVLSQNGGTLALSVFHRGTLISVQ